MGISITSGQHTCIESRLSMKVRFIEPGNRPYKPTPLNYFVYDRYIRTPSVGLNTLATIVKEKVPDTLMYSEAISRLVMEDLVDADIIFIGIFTFNAVRGYKLARYFQKKSNAVIVMGGLHASMNYKEAVKYCDYVLLGEGDESIIEMVEAVKRKETPTFPGVAYRKDGRLFHTGERKPPAYFETDVYKRQVFIFHMKMRYLGLLCFIKFMETMQQSLPTLIMVLVTI